MCDQYLDQISIPLDRWKFIDARETMQTADNNNNKKLYRLAERPSKCRGSSNVQRLSARALATNRTQITSEYRCSAVLIEKYNKFLFISIYLFAKLIAFFGDEFRFLF